MSVKVLLTGEIDITVQDPSTQNHNSVFGEIEFNYLLAALPLFLKDPVSAKLKPLQLYFSVTFPILFRKICSFDW